MEIGSGTEAGYRAKRKYVGRARFRSDAVQPCSFDRLERAEQQDIYVLESICQILVPFI